MRSMLFGTVLALATLVAVPAMAGDKHQENFPMPAATYQAKVNARQAKAREHMEKRASSLDAEKAKELRARFEAHQAKVNAEVAKAVADGTVTKEEAAAVRAVAHEGKHHKQ